MTIRETLLIETVVSFSAKHNTTWSPVICGDKTTLEYQGTKLIGDVPMIKGIPKKLFMLPHQESVTVEGVITMRYRDYCEHRKYMDEPIEWVVQRLSQAKLLDSLFFVPNKVPMSVNSWITKSYSFVNNSFIDYKTELKDFQEELRKEGWCYSDILISNDEETLIYKTNPPKRTTTLKDVGWELDKKGFLHPIAIVDGTVMKPDTEPISQVRLHSVANLKQLRLGIGDLLSIQEQYGQELIIEQNLTKRDDFNTIPVCPHCGRAVKKHEIEYQCTSFHCMGHLIGRLVQYVSAPAMNIETLGPITIRALVERDVLTDYTDIYDLVNKPEELRACHGFETYTVNLAIESIEKSKTCCLNKFIHALGIPRLTVFVSNAIAEACNHDANVFYSWLETDANLIGTTIIAKSQAKSMREWYAEHKDTLIKLRTILNVVPPVTDESYQGYIWHRKKVAIQGRFEQYPRCDIHDIVTQTGGIVTQQPSPATHYCIVGKMSPNTMERILKTGVTIIDEQQFLSILNTPMKGEK